MEKKTNEPTAMATLFWQMVDDFRDMGEKLATVKRENDELKKELDNWKQYAEDLTKELDETKLHLNNYKFIAESASKYSDKQTAIIQEIRDILDDDPDWID